MKSAIRIVGICAVLCCAVTFNLEADPAIAKCKSVLPSKHFNESKLNHHWKATHYSNPAYFQIANITCFTADIQTVNNGVEVTFDLLVNETHTNASDVQIRSKTPGIYEVNSAQPTGTAVYVLHQGHLLIYGCFHYENKYEDFSLVLSKKHHTPREILEFFKEHVNGRNGSHERYFHQFPETHCT